MKGSRIAKLVFLGMAVLGAVETAQADTVYAFTTIYVNSANGINSSGQIVGTGGNGGFLYSSGSFATIAVPGNTITVPYGINNSGQIVGSFFDSTLSICAAFSASAKDGMISDHPRGRPRS